MKYSLNGIISVGVLLGIFAHAMKDAGTTVNYFAFWTTVQENRDCASIADSKNAEYWGV